jgi:hypothetical protein
MSTQAERQSGRGAPSGQLRLLTSEKPRPDWALDERTRAIGRKGIAQVRETLRRAQPPEPIKKAS